MSDKIIIFKDKARDIFYKEFNFECIASGYRFTEGPIWDSNESCFYFTDFQDNMIYCFTKKNGVSVYRRNSNRAIGLAMDNCGNIISTESSKHRIAMITNNNSTTIAKYYKGKRFNSPNDVVVSKDGTIWFTDPYSEAMGIESEIGINGVYCIEPNGNVKLVCGSINRPNGIALSVDETILYVNDTNLQQIFTFDINKNSDFGKLNVLTTLDTSYGAGAVDGMKIDYRGNIWVTGPAGIWVLEPTGEPLAILKCPEYVGNFCFGGENMKDLYITASSSVYKVPIKVDYN
jgi:Gluconolactonase